MDLSYDGYVGVAVGDYDYDDDGDGFAGYDYRTVVSALFENGGLNLTFDCYYYCYSG